MEALKVDEIYTINSNPYRLVANGGGYSVQKLNADGTDYSEPTFDEMLKIVLEYYDVTKENIFGKSRKRKYVEPRHVLMSIAREAYSIKGNKLSMTFNRTYASVLNGRQRVRDFYFSDKVFRQRLKDLITLIFESEERQEDVLLGIATYQPNGIDCF